MTLQGATFYSLTLQTDATCPGGAQDWSDQTVALFDLTTGARVDPFTLLPASLRPDSPLPEASGTQPDAHPPLTRLYLDVLTKTDAQGATDCTAKITRQQALTPDRKMHFLLYPEAESHSLFLVPQGLAHAEKPCEIAVPLPLALLQSLGAAPRLVADLRR